MGVLLLTKRWDPEDLIFPNKAIIQLGFETLQINRLKKNGKSKEKSTSLVWILNYFQVRYENLIIAFKWHRLGQQKFMTTYPTDATFNLHSKYKAKCTIRLSHWCDFGDKKCWFDKINFQIQQLLSGDLISFKSINTVDENYSLLSNWIFKFSRYSRNATKQSLVENWFTNYSAM